MTIQEMKDKKKEKGYTYVQMAELSGVPLGTIQKIFSGETEVHAMIRFWHLNRFSQRNL